MPTLSPEEKGTIAAELGGLGVPWTSKLDASETTYATRLLNRIFTYNLLPTTHQTDMSPEMVYVIRNVLYHRPMDLSEILYTKMIKATESQDPRTSLYFPILIMKLMQKNGIKFHSPPQRQSENINTSTVLKMQKLTTTRKSTKSLGTSTTSRMTFPGHAITYDFVLVPDNTFQKLVLKKLQGIETKFEELEVYVKRKSM